MNRRFRLCTDNNEFTQVEKRNQDEQAFKIVKYHETHESEIKIGNRKIILNRSWMNFVESVCLETIFQLFFTMFFLRFIETHNCEVTIVKKKFHLN